jgi:hypothetical protein
MIAGNRLKKAFLFLALLWRLVPAAGQESPADLILLLDISASMSGSYREVRDYITGPFLKEYLRFGDTFHIISFSATPRLEIARRIEGRGDLETLIGRLFLLYPLEPGSDIQGALAYLESYLSRLPPSRPKKIVLVSDGEAVPELAGAGGIEKLIAETKTRLAGRDAALDFVSVPLRALPSPRPARAPLPDQPPVPPPVSVSPASPALSPPPGEPPAPLRNEAAARPLEPESGLAGPPALAPLSPPSPSPPLSPAPPPVPLPPAPEIIRQNPRPEGSAAVFMLPALSVLALLGLAVFFQDRRLRGSPGRAAARAANPPAPLKEGNSGLMPPLEGRTLMLSLFVKDQNTFIGKRNIHAVKPGVTFTVGGGKSDFLIFLVPMPYRIADLRYDGGSCLLIPRKPEFFPGAGSCPVKDCIGKTIRVVSDKNYELFMRIELREDFLAVLNRLMNSIVLPNLPGRRA